MPSIKSSFEKLLLALRESGNLRAIGKTSGETLPEDGYSDIDLFLFCDAIPAQKEREKILSGLATAIEIVSFGEREHPHWGLVDSILIRQQEVYLMYFTTSLFQESVESILRGERTEREENYFYPTGRLASIKGMHAFFDPTGFLSSLQSRIADYSDMLQQAILARCLPKIDDAEDFMRAIRRGDVLFFHTTLDLALDRFLQALFALNRVYFPSRKRSLTYIDGFAVKPQDCAGRLERVVSLGASADTLAESYRIWQQLCLELTALAI